MEVVKIVVADQLDVTVALVEVDGTTVEVHTDGSYVPTSATQDAWDTLEADIAAAANPGGFAAVITAYEESPLRAVLEGSYVVE